jgi:hypothetical protein
MKTIKQLLKRKQDVKRYGVTECYNHKGIRFFNFVNPLELPYFRYLKVMNGINQSALKAQVSDVIAYTDMIDDFARNRDFESILKYSHYLRAFVDLEYTHTLLFNIAEPLIMMDGEDPQDESNKWAKMKKDLFDEYPRVKSFFLRMGYAYLMTFQNRSIGHLKIEDCLKKTEVRKTGEVFLKLMRHNISATSSVK